LALASIQAGRVDTRDLFFAFDHPLDVDRQRAAVLRPERIERHQAAADVPLVIADAARVGMVPVDSQGPRIAVP
jgi:hypothetical protein